jgi:hypothetical protein
MPRFFDQADADVHDDEGGLSCKKPSFYRSSGYHSLIVASCVEHGTISKYRLGHAVLWYSLQLSR